MCREFVTVARDDVTLRGDPAGLSQEHAPTFVAQSIIVQDSRNIGVRVRVNDTGAVTGTVSPGCTGFD